MEQSLKKIWDPIVMSKELSQSDLEEIKLCLGDCQVQLEKDKDDVKHCVNANLLRKFFLTAPGCILIIVILYLAIRSMIE